MEHKMKHLEWTKRFSLNISLYQFAICIVFDFLSLNFGYFTRGKKSYMVSSGSMELSIIIKYIRFHIGMREKY